MISENAGEITILASLLILWLNFKQVTMSFSYAQNKVQEFKKMLQEEAEGVSMLWPNLFFYLLLPVAFLALLLETHLAEWVLLLCISKFIIGGLISMYFQRKILQAPALTHTLFYAAKIDYCLNVLLFVFIPLGLVL